MVHHLTTQELPNMVDTPLGKCEQCLGTAVCLAEPPGGQGGREECILECGADHVTCFGHCKVSSHDVDQWWRTFGTRA